MATSSILKANSLLFSNRRQKFQASFSFSHGCSVKSVKYRATPKFIHVQVKCSLNSSSLTTVNNNTSITKNEITIPFESETKSQLSIITNSKNPIEKVVHELFSTILQISKLLRVPVIVIVLSLMMYGGCDHSAAWARSGGAAGGSRGGGRSRSSRSSHSRGGRSHRSSHSSSSAASTSTDEELTELTTEDKIDIILLLLVLLLLCCGYVNRYYLENRTAVFKLQVGLLLKEPSFQRQLNRIAETTDSSRPVGWSILLKKTIETLLKHESCWISGYSSVNVKGSIGAAERYFKKLSNEERGKFDEETLVNLNNTKKKMITNQEIDLFRNTYLVVTILVSANETFPNLPTIIDREGLKKALNELFSHNYRYLQGVHVLLSPQKENEVMLLEELQREYPLLKEI